MKFAQFSFKRAEPSDFQAISRLLGSVDLPIEGVSENIDNFLVARDLEGQLIGVAGVEVYGESGLLRSVAVSVEHRGQGLGQLLVKGCIAQAKKQRVRRLYLLTETAEKFMKRFGFRRTERELVDTALQSSEEFKGACPDTAVTMLLEG